MDMVAKTIDKGNGNIADTKYRAINTSDNAKIVA
jgi:hypothetical protein